jgi:hypothetical protein
MDAYYASIISLFLYNQQFKEDNTHLFKVWKDYHLKVREPINIKYKSNEPTEKQKSSYISYDELLRIKNALPIGSIERLLLTMYTEIPPVRSDYYATKIIYNRSEINLHDESLNYILLDDAPILVLEKYKTSDKYGIINITLPDIVINEIKASLLKQPRKYLFTSNTNNEPFKEMSYNKWANRIIKRILDNDSFSLSMFRHIYISRRDINIEEKSGLEQQQIATIMGHSIEQQRKYLWHTWLKNTIIN